MHENCKESNNSVIAELKLNNQIRNNVQEE